CVMVSILAASSAAGPSMRLVGQQAEAVVTRSSGVSLAASAAQYVIDGIKAQF
ncbi:hypothetical protein OY671_007736, partial [Metschnikowia pulcherrima]